MDGKPRASMMGGGKVTPSQFKLQWRSVTNERYNIDYSPTLFGGSWTGIATNLMGDGGIEQFTDTTASDTTRFYRVRVAQ